MFGRSNDPTMSQAESLDRRAGQISVTGKLAGLASPLACWDVAESLRLRAAVCHVRIVRLSFVRPCTDVAAHRLVHMLFGSRQGAGELR